MSDSSSSSSKSGSHYSIDHKSSERPPCNCLIKRIIVLPRGFAESLHGFLAKKGFVHTGWSFDGQQGNPNLEDGYAYFQLPVGWRILYREDDIRVVVDLNGQAQLCTIYGGLAAWIVNSADCNFWLYNPKLIVDDDDKTGNKRFAEYRKHPKSLAGKHYASSAGLGQSQ